MGEVLLVLVFASGIGLIYWAARSGRTHVSLRGKDRPFPESPDDAGGSLLLTGILGGSSSQPHTLSPVDTAHHGACDNLGHDSGGIDCGSHGGFDGGGHH